jgi:hypothetical protein
MVNVSLMNTENRKIKHLENESTNSPISRRQFFTRIGYRLTGASLLSLLGCQNNTDYNVPQIIDSPPSSIALRPKYPSNLPNSDTKDGYYSKWLPLRHFENRSKWNAIIVHHTATDTGSASIIDRIHRNMGFDGLGYDFIINSGNGNPDGLIEVGYRWKQQLTGAHCRSIIINDNYWNKHSIGIALVGNFEETWPSDQQYESLAELITFLKDRYYISDSNILGHKQILGCNTKCPGTNFSWYKLKSQMNIIS